MVFFLFKLLIFDFVYSFAVGTVLLVIMLPFVAKSDENQVPSPVMFAISLIIGALICAGQGIIVAHAANLSLAANPDRWSVLWYVIGFIFAVPIALVKGLGDPEQSRFSGVGICASNVAYVVCIFVPHLAFGPLAWAGKFLAVT